jgi:hypothetical protein
MRDGTAFFRGPARTRVVVAISLRTTAVSQSLSAINTASPLPLIKCDFSVYWGTVSYQSRGRAVQMATKELRGVNKTRGVLWLRLGGEGGGEEGWDRSERGRSG